MNILGNGTGGMNTNLDFERLMAEARAGAQPAIVELIEQFGPSVLRAVRRRLARELRPRFDSIDFTQAVWGSFFTDSSLLTGVATPEELSGLLTKMAEHKVIDEFRRHLQTDKRDLHRERSLHSSSDPELLGIADRQPTPSKVLIADERWNELLEAVPARHRDILRLRLTGLNHQEIAQRLDINERTVERVLARLRPR